MISRVIGQRKSRGGEDNCWLVIILFEIFIDDCV